MNDERNGLLKTLGYLAMIYYLFLILWYGLPIINAWFFVNTVFSFPIHSAAMKVIIILVIVMASLHSYLLKGRIKSASVGAQNDKDGAAGLRWIKGLYYTFNSFPVFIYIYNGIILFNFDNEKLYSLKEYGYLFKIGEDYIPRHGVTGWMKIIYLAIGAIYYFIFLIGPPIQKKREEKKIRIDNEAIAADWQSKPTPQAWKAVQRTMEMIRDGKDNPEESVPNPNHDPEVISRKKRNLPIQRVALFTGAALSILFILFLGIPKSRPIPKDPLAMERKYDAPGQLSGSWYHPEYGLLNVFSNGKLNMFNRATGMIEDDHTFLLTDLASDEQVEVTYRLAGDTLYLTVDGQEIKLIRKGE